MGIRVTDDEVREIIELDATLDLTAFITVASLLVDTKLDSEISSDDLKKEIERWLAAHFVALRDPRAVSESIDSVSQSLETPRVGEGLNGTRYGQMALLLDTTGMLRDMNLKRAKLAVINTYTEPGSQSDYLD